MSKQSTTLRVSIAITLLVVVLIAVATTWVIYQTENRWQDYSSQFTKSFSDVAMMRGTATDYNELLLADATKLIADGNWEDAEESAQLVMQNLTALADSRSEQQTEWLEQAEWLNALCQMQARRYTATRRQLRHIAQSDSRYKEQAEELLGGKRR